MELLKMMTSEEMKLNCNQENGLSTNNFDERALNPGQKTESVASMKIFTSVMLNAWRRRRADVQRLQVAVDRLKTNSIQMKNDLHVSNTLMRVEQKRCQDLQLELKMSNLSINQVRDSCEMLSTSLVTLEADKEQLELDLSQSRAECSELHKQSRKINDDLLSALLEHRSLQHLLAAEQRYVHQLTLEKNQLVNELIDLQSKEKDFRCREESYIRDLEQKDDKLRHMRSIIQKEQELYPRSGSNASQWSVTSNDEEIQGIPEATNLNPKLMQNLMQIITSYGIDQLYRKVNFYSSKAAYLLWYTLLPYKSARNGCMPSRNLIFEEKTRTLNIFNIYKKLKIKP